jgi:hypothetical protein
MTLPKFMKDIAAYLQTNSFGTLGTDIFMNEFSSSSPNCISLSTSPGMGDITTASMDIDIHRPELNVKVRNKSAELAESKAIDIYNFLNHKSNLNLTNTRILSIVEISPPFIISKTESEGTIFSINFSLEIQ